MWNGELRGSIYDRFRFVISSSESGVDGPVIVRTAKTATQQQLALTALALRLYELENHGYPESLNSLVPDMLPEIPRDFMDGTPLKYRRLGVERFLLYSSGNDGIDDGGDPTWSENATPWSDIWIGKDAVWPEVFQENTSN